MRIAIMREQSLSVFLLFMLDNLFYEIFIIIQYILGNKIKAITFIDICTIGFDFINKKFAEIIYKSLEI